VSFRIIPRSEWGAKYAPSSNTRTVRRLEKWLHHSVTVAPDVVPPFDDDYAAVRSIEAITEGRFGIGMAYTFLVTPAGLIFEGHPIDRVGAHTAGHNRYGVGICLVGNYENAKPTAAQKQAVAWLIRYGIERGWWEHPSLNGGHRDTKATACPGRYAYAVIDEINALAAAGEISGGPGASAPVPAPAPAKPGAKREPRFLPTLREQPLPRESSGWDGLWQATLHELGYGEVVGKIDGKFGPATTRGTIQFQKDHGLTPDGVVGPRTWTAAMLSGGDNRLKAGDRGKRVEILQNIVRVATDMVFGDDTGNALGEVQRWLGIDPDEVFGPDSRNALIRKWP
jgi:peptidoglycan hydrolase-like protein with peptidoglycan-binding domain